MSRTPDGARTGQTRKAPANRCAGCGLYPQLCVCPLLAEAQAKLQTSTRLHLLLHVNEVHKPTNSGRLAARMLAGSVVSVVGHGRANANANNDVDDDNVDADRGVDVDRDGTPLPPPPVFSSPALLLFPSEDAQVLTPAFARTLARPLTLVVPDGTWRQARKMRMRVPGLSTLPTVTLPTVPGASFQATEGRLRRESREGGVATIEAIAAALRILDGDAVADALNDVYRVFVDRTLWLRGALRDHEVTGGIPALARQYDPRGGAPLPATLARRSTNDDDDA